MCSSDLHGGDDGKAFGLDQRRAQFDDVDVLGNLAGQFEGGFGGQEVDGNLELHDVVSFCWELQWGVENVG